MAGWARDEAQPQPDRDGQGDLSRCHGADKTHCGEEGAGDGKCLLGPVGLAGGAWS